MMGMLGWLPQKYMLDTLGENPKLARYHKSDGFCAVLFGHYLFIGGRWDPEAARFLAGRMMAEHVTFAFCPDDQWQTGLRALFQAAKTQTRALYAAKPTNRPGGKARS